MVTLDDLLRFRAKVTLAGTETRSATGAEYWTDCRTAPARKDKDTSACGTVEFPAQAYVGWFMRKLAPVNRNPDDNGADIGRRFLLATSAARDVFGGHCLEFDGTLLPPGNWTARHPTTYWAMLDPEKLLGGKPVSISFSGDADFEWPMFAKPQPDTQVDSNEWHDHMTWTVRLVPV